MSGTEPRIAEIVAEVLAEHELELAYGVDVDGCSCGAFWLTTDDAWRQHVAQLVAERLQAAEVGACGAAGGEVDPESYLRADSPSLLLNSARPPGEWNFADTITEDAE